MWFVEEPFAPLDVGTFRTAVVRVRSVQVVSSTTASFPTTLLLLLLSVSVHALPFTDCMPNSNRVI
jgi:hypothetical protein